MRASRGAGTALMAWDAASRRDAARTLVCRSDGCTPHAAAAISAASDDKAKPSRGVLTDGRARNTRTYDHTHRARAASKIADGAGKNRPTRTARRRPIFQP